MPSTITRSPTTAPAGGCISSTLPLEEVAHITMPCESKPCIFLGFKFARTITSWPAICSSVRCARSPEATVRGPLGSPRSISSQYSFSAWGCGQTFRMRPTRMLRREISSSGRSALPPGDALALGLALASGAGFDPCSGSPSRWASLPCNAATSAFLLCAPSSLEGSTFDVMDMSLAFPSGILIKTIGLPGGNAAISTMKYPRRSSCILLPLLKVFSKGSPIAGVSIILQGLMIPSRESSSSILAFVTRWSYSRSTTGVI
mmetsp:Transcript_36885/g.102382  ORF Transcript_36885/g.102382 Transcript_36885/m.102382 type:complete len:260 (-) Transcript_36885:1671-2450(-)